MNIFETHAVLETAEQSTCGLPEVVDARDFAIASEFLADLALRHQQRAEEYRATGLHSFVGEAGELAVEAELMHDFARQFASRVSVDETTLDLTIAQILGPSEAQGNTTTQ